MIKLDRDICTNFEAAHSREWLETNGIGGFACGTVAGAHARRYHGLLTAATRPPLGRVVMLSKFEETLTIGENVYELSANRYPQTIYPRGFELLDSFRLDPFPIWTFAIEDLLIEKKIFMAHGENTTVVQYRVINQSQITDRRSRLALRPLLAFRDYHHLRRATDDFDTDFDAFDGMIAVQPVSQWPPLFFAHNGARIEKTGFWYRDFEYAIERERGFDDRENLYQPFALEFDLSLSPASVVVSTEHRPVDRVEQLEAGEIVRRENLIIRAEAEDETRAQLVLAADQFIVARGAGKTVIAGYPWFSDWGRDTMIALPGLTLATNRAEIAREILLEYSRHISEGMIPNRFPDAGDEAEYNTVDATLWYFEAVRAYAEKTRDFDFVRDHLYGKLNEIVTWHLRGTRYQIHVDTDGLLYAGEAATQLTWMDAKIGDWVVTPRVGKPVEIQALWYNALITMADFAARFDEAGNRETFLAMAEAARQSFAAVFWNEAEECLYDVVAGGARDGAVRPNQIFAVSLTHAILDDAERARKVIAKVETELLTPVGLRSLSPKDENYRPVYAGSPLERDAAYHQGTVWGWPIGAFVDAYRKTHGEAASAARVEELLSGFAAHLAEAGLGQISEIFDARAPHAPRGCMAQAWSVAEVLRVMR